MTTAFDLDPITRLTRDLKTASKTLGRNEARFLVDAYYQVQDYRKAAGNQDRSLGVSGEPHAVISWLFGQMETLEKQIKRALDAWTDEHPTGRWMKGIVGIGPVLSAGLLAHIDITKVSTVGQIWRFAGLDPTTTWEKKQKRPWNADLKVLCFKVGESFIKFQNHPKDTYGKLYVQRKAQEQERNCVFAFRDQAERVLAEKKIGKDTEAFRWYSQGMLPPAHIHARARRWVVKLFLAHYFEVAYFHVHGEKPPLPYPVAILGHAHYIAPPE